jgi:hypothetical protein
VNRQDLEELEKALMNLVVKRRSLGGFDVNAEAVLILSEALFSVVRHLRERAPRPRTKTEDE